VREGRSYLATEETLAPEIRRVAPPRWRRETRQADYLAIGPRAFAEVARPLLSRRASQGLSTAFVPIEEIFEEFGYGESRPEAIRDFLRFAFQSFRRPSPRYVVLLGDGSYDFKDHLGTGAPNHVPPLLLKTGFLLTASDPSYGAVNGDDLLPDLAVGRLPASSAEELGRMVSKILAYEDSGSGLEGASVLVTDNPDAAGDFDADAEEILSSILSGRDAKRVSLAALGVESTRAAILDSFDQGASTLSYIGHGGIHLWASENVFDRSSPALLAPQRRQPIALTLNCLNGYFQFPYFDSLAEALLKAEGRGAVAAVSPSGLSLNDPAHEFHRALLASLLSGGHERLGDAVLAAQRVFLSRSSFSELLAIYHLFGDPAMPLR
jgi:hypothetical protein